jgi:hypothetical protein
MESKASGVAVNSFTVEVLAKRASAASEAKRRFSSSMQVPEADLLITVFCWGLLRRLWRSQ